MTPEIRPATADDLTAFYGEAPKRTMKAFVAVLDGKPIAVAGLAYQHGKSAPPYLFSDIKPEMRQHRKSIVRGAREMLVALATVGIPCLASADEPGAARLLQRLGFAFVAHRPDGDMFIYEGSR